MTEYLFANFASTIITSAIAADTTAIPLSLGDGDLFPNPGPATAFQAVLTGIDGAAEVVTGTGRSGDVITVTRAQEGTAALAFATGSRFELRLTAEVLRGYLQRSGGAMAGDLDMQGHNIANAVFTSESRFNVGVRAPWIKGISNAVGIDFLTGRLPMIGGTEIITLGRLARCVFPFYGRIEHLPYWFKICDGLNDTPDLRGRFIRGTSIRAASEPDPLTTVGEEAPLTSPDGDLPQGTTGPHNLNASNTVPLVVTKTFKVDVEGGGGASVLQDMTIAYGTGNQTHTHTIPAVPQHRHQVSVIPPSMWMFYVMFKANLIPP